MGKRLAIFGAIAVVLIAAVWFGGVWTTRNEVWRAPWVSPGGVVLEGQPQIGAAYRVTLNTHCGLRHVEFDGSEWGISGVLDDGSGNPPPGFANPSDEGTVTLTSPDSAVYLSELGEQRTLLRGTGLPAVEGCL
jgi:hypothetical protein